VGERSKAGQKLNREKGISETKLDSGQGQGQGGKGDVLSWVWNFTQGPKRRKEKKKKEKKTKEKFDPGPLFLSVALKAGDKTQNQMRKVEIDDKNIVYVN